MATTTYKVLGQAATAATTETDLYTVPASTSAIGSTLVVANRAATEATFRVSVSLAGAATATKDYLIYDATISGNQTATFTIGITLATTDKVRVYGSSANLSFNLFGTQVS
jgi:hypothetical protein